MIKSWSHQLLINYILTIYVLYTKIGVFAKKQKHKIIPYNNLIVNILQRYYREIDKKSGMTV